MTGQNYSVYCVILAVILDYTLRYEANIILFFLRKNKNIIRMAIVPLSTSPYNQLIMIGALEYTE